MKATNFRAFFILCLLMPWMLESALAQGCVMCKTSLTAQAASAIQALQLGILVLLIPPLLIMSAIAFVVVRRAEEEKQNES